MKFPKMVELLAGLMNFEFFLIKRWFPKKFGIDQLPLSVAIDHDNNTWCDSPLSGNNNAKMFFSKSQVHGRLSALC
jgi:hypothetical protein